MLKIVKDYSLVLLGSNLDDVIAFDQSKFNMFLNGPSRKTKDNFFSEG